MGLGQKIAMALSVLGDVITWAIVIRAVVSWFPISRDSIIIRVLDTITEPVIAPVRNLMNKLIKRPMMVDFSPIVAMIAVDLIIIALQKFCLNLFI